MIELALPSGDLQTALIAFKNGADAVYFGMQSFSARKSAVNFSFQDLAIIRRYAQEYGKKIYITVNTLLPDEKLDDVYALLAKISYYGCDGIICQDLGVAKLIKDNFPTLPLHGSTQLAVHTIEGVKELQKFGFERVVLSRELSMDEIKKIRRACPDVELKVFIHGALCFSFSGLCMASAQSCGRSANGGACAQICRNYFTMNGKTQYFFSMTDLMLGKKIKELDEIGIDSAKIEGRMKSKEYVASLARYYRAILDNKDIKGLEEDVKTTFSRTTTTGYFDYKKDRPSLIDAKYPSHRGLKIGRVIYQNNNTIEFTSNITLNPHDGICLFLPQEDGRETPFAFSLSSFKRNGNIYTIRTPEFKPNLLDLDVYRTSDSTLYEKEVKENLRGYQKETNATLTLYKDKMVISDGEVSSEIKVNITEAKKVQDIHANCEKIFSESGDGRYVVSKLTIDNKTGFPSPFLPLSFLKELRREFYLKLNVKPLSIAKMKGVEQHTTQQLPDRALLSKEIPWNLEGVSINGDTYYTLPPITFDEEGLFKTLEAKLKTTENNIIGLNNIGQLAFAKAHKEYKYFIDVYLFLSNRYAAQFFCDELGDCLVGGYLYPEFTDHQEPWPFTPTRSDNYHLPLFLSRACFRHDSLGVSCKGCPQTGEFSITHQNKSYRVLVRDCLTIVV